MFMSTIDLNWNRKVKFSAQRILGLSGDLLVWNCGLRGIKSDVLLIFSLLVHPYCTMQFGLFVLSAN